MTKFSRAFWTANMSELFERMAYYAIFIVITLYLSNTLGFNDIEASLISGLFSGVFISFRCLPELLPTR